MHTLRRYLLEESVLLNNSILKVDTFLNQNISILLLQDICDKFYDYFKDKNIDKIITVESGGIAPSILLANKLGVDVLVLKKGSAKHIEDIYECHVKSFTKNNEYNLTCSKENLKDEQNLLLIDDFLATGAVLGGVLNIVKQANCKLVGAGFIIEKTHQGGSDLLKELKIDTFSIEKIKGFENNEIIWG
ncbi:MAG: xanthine phosphoribosyltransferase [Lachnospirales bacterium]